MLGLRLSSGVSGGPDGTTMMMIGKEFLRFFFDPTTWNSDMWVVWLTTIPPMLVKVAFLMGLGSGKGKEGEVVGDERKGKTE